jgi:hypothetical protein
MACPPGLFHLESCLTKIHSRPNHVPQDGFTIVGILTNQRFLNVIANEPTHDGGLDFADLNGVFDRRRKLFLGFLLPAAADDVVQFLNQHVVAVAEEGERYQDYWGLDENDQMLFEGLMECGQLRPVVFENRMVGYAVGDEHLKFLQDAINCVISMEASSGHLGHSSAGL